MMAFPEAAEPTDLIYEGIATLSNSLSISAVSVKEPTDLIYEGIATSVIAPFTFKAFNEPTDLIYEGIATSCIF